MKKIRWFTCVLFLCVLSGPVYATSIIVPDSECPNPWGPAIFASCYSFPSRTCERTDSSIISVSSGTPGTKDSATLYCNNCVSDCPEVIPDPEACTATLEVSHTEVVTATVASGIEASGGAVFANLKSSLESSIGHSNQRTKNFSATCGTHAVSGCAKSSYALRLGITTSIQKKIEHTYQWRVSIAHHGWGCTLPADHASPNPIVYYESAGSDVSTVVGSAYGASATCQTLTYSTVCP